MAKIENLNYKSQREPVTQQELIAYRSLCAGIFQQAVFDATDKRGTVENFISAYTWLIKAGYCFLTEILAMDLDRSRYDNFIRQLKSGDYEMFRSIFRQKEVKI
jgi:hypothetical protein